MPPFFSRFGRQNSRGRDALKNARPRSVSSPVGFRYDSAEKTPGFVDRGGSGGVLADEPPLVQLNEGDELVTLMTELITRFRKYNCLSSGHIARKEESACSVHVLCVRLLPAYMRYGDVLSR